jgi:hypothetical protein
MRIITIMLSIMFIGCIWIIDASAEQPSYVMVCKGGGNMRAELHTSEIVGSAQWITIIFEKSPQPASRQEPAPGTCAWVDRPLSPQESSQAEFYFRKLPRTFTIRQQNITISIDGRNFEDQNLKYLVDAIYNGKLFYVRCYNIRGGNLIHITSIGP